MKYFQTNIILSLVLASFFSCARNQDATQVATSKDSIFVNGNISTTISTDIEKLNKLLDFKTFKPTKVKFQYTFIDNSGQNERLSVPGSSDYSLQALLYFDSLTFKKIIANSKHSEDTSDYHNEAFRFDWLDKEVLKELENSNVNYHGYPDFSFGTTNSKLWYLDNKILIQKSSN